MTGHNPPKFLMSKESKAELAEILDKLEGPWNKPDAQYTIDSLNRQWEGLPDVPSISSNSIIIPDEEVEYVQMLIKDAYLRGLRDASVNPEKYTQHVDEDQIQGLLEKAKRYSEKTREGARQMRSEVVSFIKRMDVAGEEKEEVDVSEANLLDYQNGYDSGLSGRAMLGSKEFKEKRMNQEAQNAYHRGWSKGKEDRQRKVKS